MILIIDKCFKEGLKKIVAHAEANPLTLDDIHDMLNGERPVAGNTEGYFMIDPFGTKIVYTIENLPDYSLRHFSISMCNGKNLPHPIIIEEIMILLGFKNHFHNCIVEIENRSDDPLTGILNVAEIIN